MTKTKATRLGDILNFKRGYDLPAKDRTPGPYPVVSSSGISGYHSSFKADGEGVVTGRYGSLGQMHFLSEPYWPHNTALYVTDFKGNFPKYVYYLLSCIGHMRTSDKSAVPGVNRNELHEVAVPLLPREYQEPVAAVLSAFDDKVALNNKINAELEALARLIYDFWFIQFDFPDENGRPYKSSGGKMVWCEQLKREVPDGWATGVLSDFGRIVGGSTPSKEVAENFTSNGTPWITPNDLSDNIGNNFISNGETDVSKAGLKAASLKMLPKGSVLLSSRAPIGYMAIARNPVTTNQGFKSFVPTDRFPTEYIFYAIKRLMPAVLQNANGSTFKEISGGTLGMVKTSLPDGEIVKAFCKKVAPMLEMQNALEAQNQELASLRDWLLPMLMNGQVTVGD
jgi:type I restriction enzyme S subunit